MILDRTGSMSGVDTANARWRGRLGAQGVRPAPAVDGPGSCCTAAANSGACISTADNCNPWTAMAPGDLRSWVPVGLTGTGACFGSGLHQGRLGRHGQGHQLLQQLERPGHRPRRPRAHGHLRARDLRPAGRGQGHPPAQRRASPTTRARQAVRRRAGTTVPTPTTLPSRGQGQGHRGLRRGLRAGRRAGPHLPGHVRRLGGRVSPRPARGHGHYASANDNGCPGTENDDGDNYFCLPKTSGASTDLSEVFKKAVAQLSGHSRLVNVD